MDLVHLREQLKKHKELLKRIKQTDNVNKLLPTLNDEEVNLLLKILHLIGDGQISILSKHEETVKKAKRQKRLLTLGSRYFFRELMKKERSEKLKELWQFASLFSIFIDPMFH